MPATSVRSDTSDAHVLSIDAGTTSVRALAVTDSASVTAISQREFAQHYPQPGWVEHDAAEIWNAVQGCIAGVLEHPDVDPGSVRGIGITNQRETVVAWSRSTGEPVAPAIVWQDRRTAGRCDALRATGVEKDVSRITGLVCDPYFSGTKIEWLLTEGGVEATPDLALGTVDSWLAYKLTGGAAHVTDASNASRTLLYDISAGSWSDVQLERFGVPRSALPEIVDSSGVVGVTPDGVPVAGLAGDQQSALFGQACFSAGMSKNTYGTGSFVLVNAGATPPPTSESLLSTVAWRLDGEQTFALEGSIFVTGAAVKWLRDALHVIGASDEAGPLAASVPDSGGIVVVPAFAGLGAPYWNPHARGAVFGITRGSSRSHLVRAVVDAMAFQTRDVVNAMDALLPAPVAELRVDGGASVMDVLCQVQADQLGVDVVRPANTETTALGAAFLAGLATGVWSSLDEIAATWQSAARFTPAPGLSAADRAHGLWKRAVERVQAMALDG